MTRAGPAPAPPGHDASAWVRSFLRPERGAIALILAVSALATGVALAPPYLIKLILDEAVIAGQAERLAPLIAIWVGLAIGGAGLSVLNQWLHTRSSGRVLFGLRESLYAHLSALSPRMLQRHPEGDLLARLDGDVAEIQRFALDSVLAVTSGALGLVATLGLLFTLAPRLAALALVLIPLEWVFLRWIRPRLAERTRDLRRDQSALSSFFVETLPALKAIQAAGTRETESARLASLHRDYLGDLLRAGLWNGGAAAGPRLLSAGAQAVLFGLGGLSVIAGSLSVGSLMAFSAYLAQASRPIQTLFGVYTALARARVSFERVATLATLEPEVVSPRHPQRLPLRGGEPGEERGAIAFRDVSFAHPDGPPLLRGVSCEIPAASRVSLRGASGVGKSTWIDLLARHYDPDRGAISLDGVDLRHLDLRELRRAVAVVGQGSVLFRGSIEDNLRYGNPNASPADLQRAADGAELGALLAARDAGLGTPVAAGGRGLSGGEAQRVLLARALLQQPRVLVLDEATSEVDETARRKLHACVDRMFSHCTRIVVEHRTAAPSEGWDCELELSEGRLLPTSSATHANRHPR